MGDGVREGEHSVVKREAGGGLCAVFGVADDRMADVGKLDADLVVAAGMEGHFKKGGVGIGLQGAVGKDSFFSLPVCCNRGAVGGVDEEMGQLAGRVFEVPFDFGVVDFCELAVSHRLVETRKRFACPGKEDDS